MNLRIKVLLLATLPLILAVGAITLLVNRQAAKLSEGEIAVFERSMLEAKKAELLNYVSLALTSIDHVYNVPPLARTPESEAQAKATAKRILARLSYGTDGYFFVYDFKGRSLVHPKQPWRVGNSYINLTDANGRKVIQGLIDQARAGGGYFHYTWEQPSTGQLAEKIGYAVALDRWGWMLGTGIYSGDIAVNVARSRADTEARIGNTFLSILGIALAALFCVFATGIAVNLRESQLANTRLRALTSQIVAAQEDERARVSRDLHDGVSQSLVSVKFALERASLMLGKAGSPVSSDVVAEDIDRANENLRQAIREIRRVSQDLRPGALDDLGLRDALEALAENFAARTKIDVSTHLVGLPTRMPPEAETTFYRIAQEALANVERHAGATAVILRTEHHRGRFTIWIEDDGQGGAAFKANSISDGGMGLRNIEKRLEPYDGELRIISRGSGTRLGASIPVQMLAQSAAPTVREKERP